jgi:hypothetical protein
MSEEWTTVDATQGMKCRQTNAAGPGVWFTFRGTNNRVTVTTCDDSTDLDSGVNIFVSNTGSCDDLRCTLSSRTRGGTCATDQESASVTFLARAEFLYFVNVLSFPDGPSFDFNNNDAGTTGLVRAFTP